MIHNSAMLIDLNISTWTGRKMDKKVSDEIDQSKGTRTRAGNYHKHLLAGTAKLEGVQKVVGAVRLWHYQQTLPWSDGGARLLPMKNFFAYKQKLGEYEQQYNDAVESFLQDYPQLVSAAAFQLGALFDRGEYPDVGAIEKKFRFSYLFSPVPAVGDFRVTAADDAIKELEEQYSNAMNQRVNDAMKDIWTRLHGVLEHMSEKLADAETPRVRKDGTEVRTQVFRDSLVENAVELCGLLSVLNVTNDPELERARQSLEKAIAGVTPKDLREGDATRAAVKAEVDAILSAFNF